MTTETYMPAEWETEGYILMASPEEHTDWNFDGSLSLEQFRRLVNAFTGAGKKVLMICSDPKLCHADYKDVDHGLTYYVRLPFNDTWTRDYGPLSVVRGEKFIALDFGFNGWGLKFPADKDNLVNLNLYDNLLIADNSYKNCRDYVLEGGSIDSDGKGTILTTSRCLLSPNRNGGITKEAAEKILSERFGTKRVLWLDYGELTGDDTDSHVDTLARFADTETIVFQGCQSADDPQYEGIRLMKRQLESFRTAEGRPYRLIELPMPSPIMDEGGNRLPATYANFLVTTDTLFLPIYGDERTDRIAEEKIQEAFPKHKIVTVGCETLLIQHGSLHCSTMQIPQQIINSERLRHEI